MLKKLLPLLFLFVSGCNGSLSHHSMEESNPMEGIGAGIENEVNINQGWPASLSRNTKDGDLIKEKTTLRFGKSSCKYGFYFGINRAEKMIHLSAMKPDEAGQSILIETKKHLFSDHIERFEGSGKYVVSFEAKDSLASILKLVNFNESELGKKQLEDLYTSRAKVKSPRSMRLPKLNDKVSRGLASRKNMLLDFLRGGKRLCLERKSRSSAFGIGLPYRGSKHSVSKEVSRFLAELYGGELLCRASLISPFSGLAAVELEFAKGNPNAKIILNDKSNFVNLIHKYKILSLKESDDMNDGLLRKLFEIYSGMIDMMGIKKSVKLTKEHLGSIVNLDNESRLKEKFKSFTSGLKKLSCVSGLSKDELIERTAEAIFCCLFSCYKECEDLDLNIIISHLFFKNKKLDISKSQKKLKQKLSTYFQVNYSENISMDSKDWEVFLENLSKESEESVKIYFFDPPYAWAGRRNFIGSYGVYSKGILEDVLGKIEQIVKEPNTIVLLTYRGGDVDKLLESSELHTELACKVSIETERLRGTEGEALYILHKDQKFRERIKELASNQFFRAKKALPAPLPNFAEEIRLMSAQDIPGSEEGMDAEDIEEEGSMLDEAA